MCWLTLLNTYFSKFNIHFGILDDAIQQNWSDNFTSLHLPVFQLSKFFLHDTNRDNKLACSICIILFNILYMKLFCKKKRREEAKRMIYNLYNKLQKKFPVVFIFIQIMCECSRLICIRKLQNCRFWRQIGLKVTDSHWV